MSASLLRPDCAAHALYLCARPCFDPRGWSCAQTQAEKLGVDVSGATIVDPETAPELERYVEDLVEARKKKVLAFDMALNMFARLRHAMLLSTCSQVAWQTKLAAVKPARALAPHCDEFSRDLLIRVAAAPRPAVPCRAMWVGEARILSAQGTTPDMARDMLADVNYFGTMMVRAGDADGMVSGACHTTASTIRPGLQARV